LRKEATGPWDRKRALARTVHYPTIGESGKPEVAISDSSAIAPDTLVLYRRRVLTKREVGRGPLRAFDRAVCIKATSINGIPINANPFSFPDATLNASGPVTVNAQAQFIPVGTVPKVIVMSEIGPD
jgi:hypothetical protein